MNLWRLIKDIIMTRDDFNLIEDVAARLYRLCDDHNNVGGSMEFLKALADRIGEGQLYDFYLVLPTFARAYLKSIPKHLIKSETEFYSE